ncbi:MAG: DUF3990 domain-containing protein [Desulfocucumaceae bacterium]
MTNIYRMRSIAYHGTTSSNIESLKIGINIDLCNKKTDFGKGFYVTKDFIQAKIWACRLTETYNNSVDVKRRNGFSNVPEYTQPVIIEYKLDIDEIWKLPKYCFTEADDNWKNFVYNNRNNGMRSCHAVNNSDCKYHSVIGPMADGVKMSKIFLVNKGLIPEDDFIKEITPKGSQISFHTEVVLQYIVMEGVYVYEKC